MFDPGSFRDPSGRIVAHDGSIYRLIFEPGEAAFAKATKEDIFGRMYERGYMLPLSSSTLGDLPFDTQNAVCAVEHPRLEYISYPYEWCFSQLKAAALLHLDMHLDLLEKGFTLSDATAYNVQFIGTEPVFIDHLSVIPYEDGMMWAGQRQFCMQFLNPLIMWAKLGIAPNAWFRGSLEGIPPEDLVSLLRFRDRFSFTILAHVVAQARVHQSAIKAGAKNAKATRATLTKNRFAAILTSLRSYVSGLRLKNDQSVWGDYAGDNSYDDGSRGEKHDFIANFVRKSDLGLLFDVGCNTGDFSATALESGARSVVGFDFDFGALEGAFARFKQRDERFLPLWLDAANPSPSLGWAESERQGFSQRAKGDAVIALALIHHIAITRNVPLGMVLDWLIAMAPKGVIEFPHKEDVMVQTLLSQREDIFPDYNLEVFLALVNEKAKVVSSKTINSTRTLVEFEQR